MNPPLSADVASLVAEQLSLVQDPILLARMRDLLVEPYAVNRPWNYGRPGETRVCWTVIEHRESNTAIAYCADLSHAPWILSSLDGPDLSMGMDSEWFLLLEDAFRSSLAWTGENPPDWEIR